MRELARTPRRSASAALFCIFIRVVLRKHLPLIYLIKALKTGGALYDGAPLTGVYKVITCFSAMLSACDHGPGAQPRPLRAVHVDFDMALSSERWGMSGSRPAALQRCMGSVAAPVGTAGIRSSTRITKLRRLQKVVLVYGGCFF